MGRNLLADEPSSGRNLLADDAPPPPKDPLSDIGYSTALGGITGFAAPEVAETLGRGMEKIPYKPVQMAGKAMRAAVPAMTGGKARAGSATFGAAGGATSESLGQLAESAGAPPYIAETARVAGGLAPFELFAQGGKAATALGSAIVNKFSGGQGGAIIKGVMADVGVSNLAGKQRELFLKRIQELRNAPFTTDEQKKIYDTLSDAVSKSTSVAEAEARLATAAGERVAREERGTAQRLAGTAAELEEGKKTVIDRAKGALRQVGDATREVSEIGRTLRDRILSRFETQSLERSEAYKKQKAIRDQAVAAKENQGIYVDSTPEYKDLIKDLTNKLLIGRQPLTKKTAEVTEPGVEAAYRKIYDAITNKRVMIEGAPNEVAQYVEQLKAAGINVRQGTNPKTGKPVFYREYKTSFDAMDDVRRKLGDAAFGKAAEGYEALGQKIAQEYYAKISNLQSKFAGESHDVLQSEYELASRLLEKYRTKAGAKATAMDRIDPTQFKADAKGLPAALFNSQQSVQDAIALTGDRNLVAKEASDYVARTIANMDAKAAKNWLTSKQNSDWLSALPEVRQAANAYVANLERAESMAGGMAKVTGKLGAREKFAGKEAERALAAGEKRAGEITAAAQKEAQAILGTEEPAKRVASIITSSDKPLWDRIAPALAAAPKGKETLEAAIRQVLANKAQEGIRSTNLFWKESLSDALARTGLMDATKIKQIGDQLETIANSTLSEPQKLDFLNRTLRNIVITYAAPKAAEGIGAGQTGGDKSAYEVLMGGKLPRPMSIQPGR